MSVKLRQHIERKIAHGFILAAIKAGNTIAVDNGDNVDTVYFTSPAEVLAAMFQTDQDTLVLRGSNGKPNGWVLFIYGNTGYDVISDYTVNLEPLMEEPNKLADKYEKMYDL